MHRRIKLGVIERKNRKAHNMEYVLATGGTSGIGYELVRCFAADGYGIILVSSKEVNLKRTKQKLAKEFDVPIHILVSDLSQAKSAQEVYQKVKEKNYTIHTLLNCAGCGTVGATHVIDLEQDTKMLQLNVITLVELCKLFLPDFYQRKKGSILNVASTGAFQPGPFTSTYFASKAFVLSYSRAIRREAKEYHVNVTTLCPGTTRTGFFVKEGMKTPFYAVSAKSVARYAYRHFKKGKDVIVPGMVNKVIRRIPMSLKMAGIAKIKSKK